MTWTIEFIEKRRNTPSFSYGDISRPIDFKLTLLYNEFVAKEVS